MIYLSLKGKSIFGASEVRMSEDQVEVEWSGDFKELGRYNYLSGGLVEKQESTARLIESQLVDIPKGSDVFIYKGVKFLGRVLDSTETELDIEVSETGTYEIKVNHPEWLSKTLTLEVL